MPATPVSTTLPAQPVSRDLLSRDSSAAQRYAVFGHELEDGGFGRRTQLGFDDPTIPTLDDETLHQLCRTGAGLVRRNDDAERNQAAM
jgi:hypothetical protein